MILWLSACTPEQMDVLVEPELDVVIDVREGLRDVNVRADATDFEWTVNGAPAPDIDTQIPAARLYPGDFWQVRASGPEGVGTGAFSVPEPPGGNVLVLLLDDVGIDKVGAYGWDTAAPTPVIDGLAATGTTFTRAYASPVCSPTRATLVTGRQPRRHGIGWIVDTGERDAFLPYEATTIPEALWESRGAEAYADGVIGKWHLAAQNAPNWLTHSLDSGFSHFVGTTGNPRYQPDTGYYEWDKNDNGTVSTSTTYMTVDTVDEALAHIERMPEPWFLYVAFNAAHTPLDLPPETLVPSGLPELPANAAQRYDAVLEALDTEIGRLLDTIEPEVLERTTLLTLGDNGTSDHGIPDAVDLGRQKHTVYEGGIRVPLVVNGPLVRQPGTTCDALVHVADILPTVADITGIPLGGDEGAQLELAEPVHLDGQSLLPFLRDPEVEGREWVYAEAVGNGPPPYSIDRRAVMTRTHKLLLQFDREEFYRLEGAAAWDIAVLETFTKEDEMALAQLREILDAVPETYAYEGR